MTRVGSSAYNTKLYSELKQPMRNSYLIESAQTSEVLQYQYKKGLKGASRSLA